MADDNNTSSILETLMEGYEDGPVIVKAFESDTVLTFKIEIDKAKLVAAALPALLTKLAAPKAEPEPVKAPRKPRAKAEEPKPGSLPGQEPLPFVPPAVDPVPQAPVVPPAEKSLLHGVPIITTPGEGGLAATKAKMEAEALKKKADQEAYVAKVAQIRARQAEEAKVASSVK